MSDDLSWTLFTVFSYLLLLGALAVLGIWVWYRVCYRDALEEIDDMIRTAEGEMG